MSERLILMGVIGKAHGVRGLVRVNSFAEEPEALAGYKLTDRQGRVFTLAWDHDNVAQLTEHTAKGARLIADRNEVERLTNTELFVPRSALPEPEDEEFYLADLVGLKAETKEGAAIGTIAAVHDYGAGPSLELAPGARLVPFTKAAVPEIYLSEGRVVVVPPAEITLEPEP